MISKIEESIAGIAPWTTTPSGHDYSQRPNWIDLGFDYNSIPYKSDTLIIVTSWWGHLHFMKNTLENYRKTGAFVLLAYDFPVKSWESDNDFVDKFPSKNILLLPHAFVMKHQTFDNDKRNGWLWLMQYAAGVFGVGNFNYIVTVNSDCIWENPEGLADLKKELSSYDLMSVSSQENNIHTCAVIYREKAFTDIFSNYMREFMNTPILGSHSPEKLLTDAVRKNGIREKIAEIQPMEPDNSSVDHYSRYNQDSTWKRLVGYRNLGAEFNTCLIERTEPIPVEYIDVEKMRKVCPGFSESLYKFYETGDRRYLYQAWDHNEDSWYDRVYMPIDYYGKEPIYEIEDNRFEKTKLFY